MIQLFLTEKEIQRLIETLYKNFEKDLALLIKEQVFKQDIQEDVQ